MLNTDGVHLNEDQLYRIAVDLGLAKEERRFVQLLLERDRSNFAPRRTELTEDLEVMARRHQRSEAHLTADPVRDAAEMAAYFVDPDVTLVHIFLAVDRYRGDLRAVAVQLGLSAAALEAILTTLERFGMIALVDGRYELRRAHTHLPVDSPLFKAYRAMQRLRAMERYQRLPPERTYNFSVVFTATEAVRQAIKVEFLQLLEKVEQQVNGSPDEEVYQMSFDLFDWSR